MTTNKDIFDFLCSYAPLELQESYDNAGFVIGNPYAEAAKVVVALDATDSVMDEAIAGGAKLIITHHPPIWNPIRKLRTDLPENQVIVKAIKNDISIISMHTNLDKCAEGVNHELIHLFDVIDCTQLNEENCGCVGTRENELSMQEFLPICKDKLKASGLKYYDAGRMVKRIAVVGGSGGSFLMDAMKQGCDTLITADVKYDQFLLAQSLMINLIDGDHFSTENPVVSMLCRLLSSQFTGVQFIKSSLTETSHIYK